MGDYAKLIDEFHTTWDAFPGLARLITDKHEVLAANPAAESKGFITGCTCTKAGEPTIHRGCKIARMFESGEAQTDNMLSDRIRGWMPVAGFPNACIHFAVMIPEES